jgi:hypothetical protein
MNFLNDYKGKFISLDFTFYSSQANFYLIWVIIRLQEQTQNKSRIHRREFKNLNP